MQRRRCCAYGRFPASAALLHHLVAHSPSPLLGWPVAVQATPRTWGVSLASGTLPQTSRASRMWYKRHAARMIRPYNVRQIHLKLD